MSNYSNTKATIAANVYTNHNNEVTAAMVKTGINAVVDTLIAGGFLYKGVAHPGDPAITSDANIFVIATEAGTYTNFKNSSNVALQVADGEVAILKYNGSWSKEVTGAATAAEVSALGHEVKEFVSIARYCEIIKNYYIRYSDGASIGSGRYFQEYVLNVAELNGRKVWVKATSGDNAPAVIAFYSGDTISTANYMLSDSIQHNIVNNVTIADTTIPTGAVLMVVTTRNDKAGITEPTILLQDSAVPATGYKSDIAGIEREIEKTNEYNSELLTTLTMAVGSKDKDFTINAKKGTLFKLVTRDYGTGDEIVSIGFTYTGSVAYARWEAIAPYMSVKEGDVYYFVAPRDITGISTRLHSTATGSTAKVDVYKISAPKNNIFAYPSDYAGLVSGWKRTYRRRFITDWSHNVITYETGSDGLRHIKIYNGYMTRYGTPIIYAQNCKLRISLTDTTNYRFFIYFIQDIDRGTYYDSGWLTSYNESWPGAFQAFAIVFDKRGAAVSEADWDVISVEVIEDTTQTPASYNDIVSLQAQIDAMDVSEIQPALQRNERLGTLEIGRLYHHLNVELSTFVIPSQSLADIAYAKALGFKVIEANVQTCSDGVAVIKHGNSGKLGAGLSFAAGSGLSADTLFSAVTSTSLRQNVTYNSTIAKYNGHIPTLEEFCAECARLDMIPYLRGVNVAGLAIARKYLPDERIIVEGPASRGDFRGIMTNYGTLETAAGILAVAQTFGAPYFYGFGHMSSLSDSVVSGVFKTMHENGYMLAGAYIGATAYLKYKGMGLDLLASITNLDVPEFYHGNTLNILGCSASELVLNSASYAAATGTLSMNTNGTIKVNSADIGHNMSKLCLRIMFNGTLDIALGDGSSSTKITNLQSSGEQEFVIAQAVQNIGQDEVLAITAKAATEIIDISVYGSVVIGL